MAKKRWVYERKIPHEAPSWFREGESEEIRENKVKSQVRWLTKRPAGRTKDVPRKKEA